MSGGQKRRYGGQEREAKYNKLQTCDQYITQKKTMVTNNCYTSLQRKGQILGLDNVTKLGQRILIYNIKAFIRSTSKWTV